MPSGVWASNAQHIMRSPSENINKGKEIMLYNLFDILVQEEEIAECSTRGPNRSNPLMGELRNPPVMLFSFDNYLASSLNFIPRVGNFNPNPKNPSRTRPVWGGWDAILGFGAGLGQLKPNPAGPAGYGSCLPPHWTRPRSNPTSFLIDSIRLTHPISVEEMKLVFFDIAENKSPGPNGYTVAFYKAAWSIFGGDITLAIMDFFTNGQLLKQVDLRKINDTVEWDFLFVTMRLFGFLEGDPMSPYLFVLVIEMLPRVQLIKSVLIALNTYWAMAFISPKGIIKEIEKRLRNILRKGISETGYSKVAWPQVCNPMDEGELGELESSQRVENSGFTLISSSLTGDNYLVWSRGIRFALGARKKLGYIDKRSIRPTDDSEELDEWIRIDCMVITWILSIVAKEIVDAFIYATSAKSLGWI
ncbi:hypothetical protein Sango_0809700 [Sesamum angolense]|uniref:Retrotransposon Copia-like N-terminal domain-containing protein n=1 Tax=Sesamum angolense TaxID=2727404 RepID=A0AAE1X3G3_9LAMI|nr:hypothetical protein Sango_0809700 [Sesamum angolense]